MYDMIATILRARKRRAKALQMRRRGMTIQQVADHFEVSKARMSELLAQAKRETAGK